MPKCASCGSAPISNREWPITGVVKITLTQESTGINTAPLVSAARK
jgi:hypothetical protein